MALATLDIDTDAGSLEDLANAIDARSKALWVTTADSCVAAAIQILRSLKAATKKADPDEVDPRDFRTFLTDLWGGYKGRPPKVCARVGSPNGPLSPIRPAMGFDASSGGVIGSRVYRITSANPYDKFQRNVNAPEEAWYVLCQHDGQAMDYAARRIRALKRKSAGLAKYTLALAQAKASTHAGALKTPAEAANAGGMSPRAVQIAHESAEIAVDKQGFSNGETTVTFFDALRYSNPAAGGDGTLAAAIQKAANSMLAYASKKMNTPFSRGDNLYRSARNEITYPYD